MTSQISSLIKNDGKDRYQQQELLYHQAESMCWYFSSYPSEVIWLWSLNTSICRPWNLQWTKNPSESSNPSAPHTILYWPSFLMFYAFSHALSNTSTALDHSGLAMCDLVPIQFHHTSCFMLHQVT